MFIDIINIFKVKTNMKIFLRKTKYYILTFLVIEMIFVFILHKGLVEKKEHYYLKKINELKIAYSAIVNSYGILSKTIYNEIITKPDVIDIFKDAYTAEKDQRAEIRENLYKKLYLTYQNFKNINFVQLHFQLPDCSSFLRFHNPDKFGDNLADTRYSIKIANSKKIEVQGFEIGSIYHGYRYIYPLFYNDTHIGSIEIGASFIAIKQEMEKIFHEEFCFIMKKDIVKKSLFQEQQNNFIKSYFSENYLIDKRIQQTHKQSRACNIKIDEIDFNNKTIREKISNKLCKDEAFAVYNNFKGEKFVLTFIPITNFKGVKIAYIISYAEDSTIFEYRKDFYINITLISILFFVIISFIYYVNKSKKIIKRNRDQLQSIMDNMINGLIVLDINHKVISINPAAEKILGQYNHEVKKIKIDRIFDYKNKEGKAIPSDNWSIFDNINYGLTYTAEDGFFITKNEIEIPIELTASPRYQDADLAGFLIVFQVVNN